MEQIVTSPNEVEATVIRDFLKSRDIEASYAPNFGKNGHVAGCTVYCIADKKEEALELLKKEGLLSS